MPALTWVKVVTPVVGGVDWLKPLYVGVLSVALLGVVLAVAVRVLGRLLTPWAAGGG